MPAQKKKRFQFGRKLTQARRNLRYQRRRGVMGIRNRWRLRRNHDLGYLIYPLRGSLPERAAPRRGFIERRLPLPPPPLSLEVIDYHFDRIAEAPNTTGVLLLLKDVSGSLARLQNMRSIILRLRAAGKKWSSTRPASPWAITSLPVLLTKSWLLPALNLA